MNMACFDSRSMTTNMAVKPDEDGSCSMKSMVGQGPVIV